MKTERGFLMLTDLSGYTSFMVKSELEHAQAILRELLEMISQRLSPLFTLVEVEGDALYTYAPDERISRGETLLELVEAAYVEFRDRLDALKRHTTCGCVACQSVHTLDLKFFIHHGEYVPQKIAGNFKLIGPAVNLLHRLTKNSVTAATGWRGYALFTEPALQRLDVQIEILRPMREEIEPYGEVRTFILDLHARHRELTDARRVMISVEEADVVIQREFACSPPVLWEWLNDPKKRSMWMLGTTWTALARPSGRTGPGATNHCAHGTKAIIEQIVDWRPFDYYSTELKHGLMVIRDTYVLASTPHGTSLSYRVRMDMMLPRFLIKPLAKFIVAKVMNVDECLDRIALLIASANAELDEQNANAA